MLIDYKFHLVDDFILPVLSDVLLNELANFDAKTLRLIGFPPAFDESIDLVILLAQKGAIQALG